ncbi:phosphoenolpyruvate carboxylase [Algoriella sp.]|uniref:phosphoenolpyruvate carboxylase n=1 Tax=Algoriella sp. TaxID=1872434 RepID=UPI002FCA2CEF
MLNKNLSEQKFHQIVENKFQIYNSLFMSLPYEKMLNIGSLIPFLYEESNKGLPEGKSPNEIITNFFEKYTDLKTEKEQIDLMFRMIQYIERQVVLFDSIEDAAFPSLHSENEKGSLESIYHIAQSQGKLEQVRERIQDFTTRVVFTAHPTQFYPTNVQQIIQDLRDAIQQDSVSKIDMLLQQLGKTPFINEEKPTPYDEAVSIIYYLQNVYYQTIGRLYNDVNQLFFTESHPLKSPIIQLGFWPGGDRDGNPFVTAEITWKVASLLRTSILKVYYKHLKIVQRRLTFKHVSQPLKELNDLIYKNMFDENGTIYLDDIKSRLQRIRTILIEEHNSTFLSILDDFIMRVEIFGLHFASLDIRQDSRIHQKVINQIVEKYTGINLENVTESEKIEILTNPQFIAKPEDFEEDIVIDTIKNVYQLKDIQKRNGETGVNRYIISNSETIFDVLNVYALFKFCGYQDEEIKFDIMPLFETIRGLDGAENTMNKLYNLPIYAAHLERRNKRQSIMLGFSDGTKDGGYIKANWEIYRTKEILSDVSDTNQIEVIFFDGRGGPPARGGGKTHEFYASQGKTIANHEIQITIQGQTITSNYGTLPQAKYNFEQLYTAGIISDVFAANTSQISVEERILIDKLANISYKKYEDLKAHPSFLPYLENMSTLNYYGKTNIGSRPSKRGGDKKLEFDDLRAIPFVGSWSQLKQNIPGYFGVGTAINELKEQGRLDDVKALFKNSGFFKTLIQNSMMSMEKTYFPLTSYMKDDTEYGEFWNILHDEFELSKALCLEISGYTELMQDEPLNKSSVQLREKIVLPLLTIQQFALNKIHHESEFKSIYEQIVMRSLFGNINASRNSA